MTQKITLYDYQESLVKSIGMKLRTTQKVLAVLPTGGGKSVIIAFLANNIRNRTLILTNRTEILKQNKEWLNNCGVLTRDENTVLLHHQVVIAMVETLYSRIKSDGPNYIGSFDSIIVDEAHIDVFDKVVQKYNPKYLIGFTATPTMRKRELITMLGIEYWKTVTLKDQYDALVQGVSVAELILRGKLVEDRCYQLQLPNMKELKDSNVNPDGYTTESLTKVYSNSASLKILWEAYEQHCVGKKVLIFNATTKVNPRVVKLFESKGVPVKSFDSVHSKGSEREKVVKWFDESRSAVLVGTNVFTTGFNVTDIEVVILNRATKSLGLFIQMVGRGSRTTKKIFKDHFKVIDLGQNIERHGLWSDDRDWDDYFIPPNLEPRLKKDVTVIWECPRCEAYMPLAEPKCTECGEPKPAPQMIKRPDKTGKLVEVPRTIFPRAARIIEYTIAQGKGTAFAFTVLENKLIDLFRVYKVSRTNYINRRLDFQKRIKQIYVPIYFGIIKSKKIKGKRRKLDTQLQRMYKKMDQFYSVNFD